MNITWRLLGSARGLWQWRFDRCYYWNLPKSFLSRAGYVYRWWNLVWGGLVEAAFVASGRAPSAKQPYASKRKASTKAVRRPSNSAFLQSYELALSTDGGNYLQLSRQR